MYLSKYEDIIYSDDITNRIAELANNDERDSDEEEELRDLLMLESEAKDYCSDYDYGETLIRDSYFKEYAIELASEISDSSNADVWPYTCIDWDKAARELKYDYTAVDYGGVTYWIRST